MLDRTEINVFAMAFARQVGEHRVMKVFVPFGIELVTALGAWQQHPRIIQQALGHDAGFGASRCSDFVRHQFDVGQDVLRADVVHGVHGIESQAIEVKIADPLRDVIEHELPHRIATMPIEIEDRSPRRAIAI